MPINGLGNLMGLPGGPRKPTWRWNLNFFFMESISIIKGATTVKKEAEEVQIQKSFFYCSNTTCSYSVQCLHACIAAYGFQLFVSAESQHYFSRDGQIH